MSTTSESTRLPTWGRWLASSSTAPDRSARREVKARLAVARRALVTVWAADVGALVRSSARGRVLAFETAPSRNHAFPCQVPERDCNAQSALLSRLASRFADAASFLRDLVSSSPRIAPHWHLQGQLVVGQPHGRTCAVVEPQGLPE